MTKKPLRLLSLVLALMLLLTTVQLNPVFAETQLTTETETAAESEAEPVTLDEEEPNDEDESELAAIADSETEETIFLPVGGTYTVSGVTGQIVEAGLDRSVATYQSENSSLTFTGVKDGSTSLTVGSTTYHLVVSPKSTGSYSNTTSSIKIQVSSIDHCTVYYSINGGTLHPLAQPEQVYTLINQSYTDAFNIIFFAVPDEGYAVTTMGVADSASQYYSIADGTRADGSDSSAWPLTDGDATTYPSSASDSGWVLESSGSYHGFRFPLLFGMMSIAGMRDLYTRAIALGAEGATSMCRVGSSLNTTVSFAAEKLPTLKKEIVAVNGEAYTAGETLEFDDVVTYRFTVTSYSTNVTYSNVTLADSKIGYSTTIPGDLLKSAGSHSYEVDYTITADDLGKYQGGVFVNDATLDYTYKSDFARGSYSSSASASVSCKINGIVSYLWMNGLPEGITKDTVNYPLPDSSHVNYGDTVTVASYTGSNTYDVVENGICKGTWTFQGWTYQDNAISAGSTLTMPVNDSVEFVGQWSYTPASQYSVTYTWINAPTGVTLPVNTNLYYTGETYSVDSTYSSETTYDDGTYIHTFTGWKNGETVVSGQQTMGNSNVTLTGAWTSTPKYTSLTLTKNVSNATQLSADQTFLFRITGEGVDLTVAVHGEGSVTIQGLRNGYTYTVTEETGWAWRYGLTGWVFQSGTSTTGGSSNGAVITLGDRDNTITFTNKRTKETWLDGNTSNVNLFGSK